MQCGGSYVTAPSIRNNVTKRFRNKCRLYELFADDWKEQLSFTEADMKELYVHESHGGQISEMNGFFIGKKWMNVTITMWKEDIRLGLLFKRELYDDDRFPNEWIDKVLK